MELEKIYEIAVSRNSNAVIAAIKDTKFHYRDVEKYIAVFKRDQESWDFIKSCCSCEECGKFSTLGKSRISKVVLCPDCNFHEAMSCIQYGPPEITNGPTGHGDGVCMSDADPGL